MSSTTPANVPTTRDPLSVGDLYPELLDALVHAQGRRFERDHLTASGEPAWIAYERSVMLDGTIALLVRHQLRIDADEVATTVRKAERQAEGHSDYALKWALGCAEYVTSLAVEKTAGRGGDAS